VTIAAKATYETAVCAEAIESRFLVFVVLKVAFLESLEREDVALCEIRQLVIDVQFA
jgi:hypothetical protein